MIRNGFLVIFLFLVFEFVPKQGSSESNVIILSYTYQNLLGPERFENRLIEQYFYRIWDQKSLNWNFGITWKFGQNLRNLSQVCS